MWIFKFYSCAFFLFFNNCIEMFKEMHQSFSLAQKGQGAENKKRAPLIHIRTHFWFPKALLTLKAYDIVYIYKNIVKRHPFSLFLLKSKKDASFEWGGYMGIIHSMKGQAGGQRPSQTVWGKLSNIHIYHENTFQI